MSIGCSPAHESGSIGRLAGDIAIRTFTVFGGGGQVLLGGTLCSTLAGCVLGAPIGALGVSNIQEGLTGEDGFARSFAKSQLGEEYGDLTVGIVNLGTSVGGLARPVFKKFASSGPVDFGARLILFRRLATDFQPAVRQATSTGLFFEGTASSLGIYDTLFGDE